MQVQGPSINVNGPGVNAYPGSLDINGMPMQTGGYQTTTTTTYHSSQAVAPQTTTYQMNEQYLNADGSYNSNYRYGDGNVNYETVDYVDESNTSSGCCNRRHRFGNEFGHKRFGNAYAGNPSTLCCRRCCTGLLILLGLLALLGLILGLVFGLRGASSSSSSSSTSTSGGRGGIKPGFSGGYYMNGVYYVPITDRPKRFYLIYGTEMPCNPNNNNTITTVPSVYPNCNQVSTKITEINWWSTTTPRTLLYAVYASGSRMSASVLAVMLPFFVGVLIRGSRHIL